MPRVRSIYIYSLVLLSCEYFSTTEQDPIIARAGSHYLYQSELSANLLPNLSKEDSTVLAQNFINTWAKDHLLYDQATINLELSAQRKLNDLVERYRLDLWARSYKESVIKSMLETKASTYEINNYYQNNLNSFKLNEDIIQIRYIILPKDNIDLELIQESFKNFTEEDITFLNSLSYQFSDYEFDDSVWITRRSFDKKFLDASNRPFENYLKKSQFFIFDDAIEVYLLLVNDFKFHNEIAPLPMVENTIKKIVFNRKKIEFIKEFDQEILQDAIQTNKFEIYP